MCAVGFDRVHAVSLTQNDNCSGFTTLFAIILLQRKRGLARRKRLPPMLAPPYAEAHPAGDACTNRARNEREGVFV